MRLSSCIALCGLAGCIGHPYFTPGTTRRADVLLALGEPTLSFAADRELVYPHLERIGLLPPEDFYRAYRYREGLILSDRFALRPPPADVYVFDQRGILVRRHR